MTKKKNKPLIRTVIRKSLLINSGKIKRLDDFMQAYNKQRDDFLIMLSKIDMIEYLSDNRFRDKLVSQHFVSPYNLQGRAWKSALTEAQLAFITMWETVIKDIGLKITPFELMNLYKTDSKIRRKVRKFAVKPRVKKFNSAMYDPDMYTLYIRDGKQFLSLMTNDKRKCVFIPLLGVTNIRGNIHVILDKENKTIYIHTPFPVKKHTPLTDSPLGTDTGITEMITDSDGDRWDTELGDDLTFEPNRNRARLWSLYYKYIKSKNPKLRLKAFHILKYNLGVKKSNSKRDKQRATISNHINHGINEFIHTKQPRAVIGDDLTHLKPPKGRGHFSRTTARWTRGVIASRLDFKLRAGSRYDSVNTAYSSQICPWCDYVDAKNRKGDIFKCRNCGMILMSDHSASIEHLKRKDDKEITLYTPYKEVRVILQRRFETPHRATVPGKTSLRADSPKPASRAKQTKVV